MYLPEESLLAKYAIRTHFVVKVVAVHPENQTVDVVEDVYRFTNSMIPFTTVVNELGNPVDVGLAKKMKLLNIPVKQERWGQFAIQCNPAVGDTGYIEIMTNDIREWMINGSDSIPWTDNHFDERSCVFVPFVPNLTNKAETYPADNSQLVIKSNNLSVTFTDKPAEQGQEAVKNISVVGDVNVSGDVAIDGNITTTGNIESEGAIQAKGNIKSTDGDIIAGTVSLKNHKHKTPSSQIIQTITGQVTAVPNTSAESGAPES